MEQLRALVTEARLGNLAAFGRLVESFQQMALGLAYARLRDAHLAEDAAQEAFLQAYHDLPTLRRPEAFPKWFRQIVLKHCDRLTRRKRIPTVPEGHAGQTESGDPRPSERLESQELKDCVLQAIEALPERQQVTTKLFYVDGLSQKQVAEFMEVPVSTVKKRLYEARQEMKRTMAYLDEED